MTQNNKVWPAAIILCGLMLALSIVSYCQVANLSAEPTDLSGLEGRLDKIELALLLDVNASAEDNSLVQEMYDEMFELKKAEADDVAEELALDEIDSKDFKKNLVVFLNSKGANIEDYKDIERVVVKDVDVSGFGDDRDVELELKVYFFNDGDNDEEDIEKAKLNVLVKVEDLDEDDNYEYAEAELVDADFVKFY